MTFIPNGPVKGVDSDGNHVNIKATSGGSLKVDSMTLADVMAEILIELRTMNVHLTIMTDEELGDL